jgi:hypothetical protein
VTWLSQSTPIVRAVILPVLLAFGVIGWEQLQHTTATRGVLPLYEVLHWLSDSLLALPLALAAVWCGERLARWQRFGRRSLTDHLGRAVLISLVFALLLVPGAAIHELADSLTHAHAAIAVHSHVAVQAVDPQSPAAVLTFAAHALGDGLAGQVIGLPVAWLTLMVAAWQRSARAPLLISRPQRKARIS